MRASGMYFIFFIRYCYHLSSECHNYFISALTANVRINFRGTQLTSRKLNILKDLSIKTGQRERDRTYTSRRDSSWPTPSSRPRPTEIDECHDSQLLLTTSESNIRISYVYCASTSRQQRHSWATLRSAGRARSASRPPRPPHCPRR